MKATEVLIVGAGPTGLVLALWLTRLGVKIRIVDKTAGPGATSRALAVQARTLELYRQLGLADLVVERGQKASRANLWVQGETKAQLDLTSVGADLTPYPFIEMFPQDQHERLLVERLDSLGVVVERNTELLGFTDGEQVVATLRGRDGAQETVEAGYLAGCDGGHSLIRQTLATKFSGGTYQQIFYVADVEGSGRVFNGEVHIDLDEADFLAVFPLNNSDRARLVGTVRDERAAHPEALRFEDVSAHAMRNLDLLIDEVKWFSTYRVHHRVTDRFRVGRAFLLGDAAHLHTPAGGQGMNTGIGDAINLAWKLQAVLKGKAPDELLNSYEAERLPFAKKLVATTDRVFTFATTEGRLADTMRTRIAPVVLPTVLKFEPAREFFFRTVSQLALNYRESPLSKGSAGPIHGGDRLPWARVGSEDNFASLVDPVWQVQVYGTPAEEVSAWCDRHGIPLHRFEWRPEYETVGFARDALYLIRPDTYVALVDTAGRSNTLDRYFADRGLRP